MKYPYNQDYQPAFPACKISLYNSENDKRTEKLDALLDTGSDGSMVPIVYLQQILATVLTDARIRSHWGEPRLVQLFEVDIELGDMTLPGVFVVGDEEGDEIILGRDVLNKLIMRLNGPARQTEIK